jgi:hypothetical protein
MQRAIERLDELHDEIMESGKSRLTNKVAGIVRFGLNPSSADTGSLNLSTVNPTRSSALSNIVVISSSSSTTKIFFFRY